MEIENVYKEIRAVSCFKITRPHIDFDSDYNRDYRFRSRSDCEEAGENRRERAYNDGLCYIKNLSSNINKLCLENIGSVLTQWKRLVLQAFDFCGMDYPNEQLVVKARDTSIWVDLSTFDDVRTPDNSLIKDYITKEVLKYGTSVGEVKYISEYSRRIEIREDYDLKETFFGGLKEVNHRYGYMFDIYDYESAALKVGTACVEELEKSGFVKQYLKDLGESFIQELKEIIKQY